MKELSNHDLFQLSEQLGLHNLVVFIQSSLTQKLKKVQKDVPYIMNLDIDRNGRGTHWVAFFRHKNLLFYFDSYGFLPPEIFDCADIMYNITQIQDLESTTCGYFCLAFLYYMLILKKDKTNKKLAFNKFINSFSHKDLKQNDQLVVKIIENLCSELNELTN